MARINITGDLAPQVGPDSTPVGQARVVETVPGNGKYAGTDGDDKATLDTIARDTDGVVKLGAGDDVFIFGVGEENGSINGVVSMGDGGNDRVFLTHSLEDYTFTIREGGKGIKIQYLDPDGDGAAVTFYGAEQFVFRNILDDGNHANTVLTADQLLAAITSGTFDTGFVAV